MPLVPDPNCNGRGTVPFYTGGTNPDGTPAYSGMIPDPRCLGTGVVWVDEVFPQSLTTVAAEEYWS